ncbi:hypothetical protein [uncultured Sulfitobacter sp.]|uniref:hypothetical protein n=1 Tax=uncultured Sulfitobacter sp. TaxID=191468 RepID=UPI002630C961|nr:hypothetical protein [uncultured Sulfitobacter sp.]
MYRLVWLFPLLFACAPLQTNYKPGVSVAQLNRDQTECDVRAERKVPSRVQIRRLPPEYIPGREVCRKNGKCRVIAGYWIPGETVAFDPTENLRARVGQQCMAERGYAPVSIPQCSDAVRAAAPARVTTRLPRLTDSSCVIRNSDGSFQIVNAG